MTRLRSRIRTSCVALAVGLLAGLSTPSVRAADSPADADSQQALPADAPLSDRIDAALGASFLADAVVGIYVVDLDNKDVLYARGQDKPLNPASNVKLLTTAAALLRLGPEHRYSTRLYRKDGSLSGATISGDVFLRGSGDPSLSTEDLDRIAGELQARGIKRITGGVVVDSSRFDRDELPPGFDQKEELASYRAPSSATSINFNTFVVRVQPGAKVGDAAQVGLDPPVHGIKLVNEAKTVAGHGRKLFADIDTDKGFSIRFHGEIGVDAAEGAYRYPITEPSQYAGEVMAVALKRHGIKLGRSRVKTGTVPSNARALATAFSPPLSVLIRSVNKFSNNFMAEQILKTMSEPGGAATFADALTQVRATLTKAGVNLDGAKLGNGSGLYDTNRISPKQIVSVLRTMYGDFRYRSDYLAALAVMGVDGTTRSRLRDTESAGWIRVKTGTLDGISALSGYVGAKGRSPIVFSILFNDLPRGGTGAAREVQNQIVDLLARFAAGRPLVDTEEPTP